MYYFIKYRGQWLNGKSIDNGWIHAFSDDPRVAKFFPNQSEAELLLCRLKNYGVEAQLIECPYSCPAGY